MNPPVAHSFYRSNIPKELLRAQRNVFAHFNIPLKQWHCDSMSHAAWMEWLLAQPGDSQPMVICDIDAFPLDRGAYDRLVARASDGVLIGLAQVANHKDPSRIYAGPMFIAMPPTLYSRLGAPSLEKSAKADVAQVLTDRSEAEKLPVERIPPSFAICPKWALSDQGVFGIGTFYGDMEFFHLFQSRKRSFVELFCAVAEGTIAGQHDYQKYLDTIVPRKRFLRIF